MGLLETTQNGSKKYLNAPHMGNFHAHSVCTQHLAQSSLVSHCGGHLRVDGLSSQPPGAYALPCMLRRLRRSWTLLAPATLCGVWASSGACLQETVLAIRPAACSLTP